MAKTKKGEVNPDLYKHTILRDPDFQFAREMSKGDQLILEAVKVAWKYVQCMGSADRIYLTRATKAEVERYPERYRNSSRENKRIRDGVASTITRAIKHGIFQAVPKRV